MSIELKSLAKVYDNQHLFKEINLSFKDKGFYVLLGKSGCGKTTLLNILSLIDTNYSGKYNLNDIDVRTYDGEGMSRIRATKFAYIFQNFNLFDDDTVYNNVSIMIDSVSPISFEFKNRKVNEVLEFLEISKLKNEYVKNLSGGEKQRVAIARALISSPEVIFCDEPTGALDNENSKNVFSLLKKISKEVLVICVTHDEVLANKYADEILLFKNKRIQVFHKEKSAQNEQLKFMKVKDKNKHATLSFRFLFRHLKNKFKAKRFRNLIRNFLLSIALLMTGLSLSLTTGIHTSLTNSFSTLIDQNTIVMTKKDCKNLIYDYYSAGKTDIYSLLNDYKDDIDYYGVNYVVDYENYFVDENDFYLFKEGKISRIDGFNIRMFNEFTYVENFDEIEVFPSIKSPLKNDEIVISINYEQMKKLCLELRILRSFEDLGKYLSTHDVMVGIRVENNEWSYYDEQVWKLKGVIMDAKNRVYHTNNLFNEFVFEESMRMPVTNRLEFNPKAPWNFPKVYYVHTKLFQTYFLDKILYDEDYKNFIFDSDNSSYSPLSCPYSTNSTNKLYVFNVFHDSFEISKIKELEKFGFKYDGYYFSTNLGYYNNGTSIFSGFARPVFLSPKLEKIEEIIDAHSKVSQKEFLNIKVPSGVVDGYAFKPSSSNLKLKTSNSELKPDEIIISGGFKNIIEEEIEKPLDIYISLLKSSSTNEQIVQNNFETVKLKIVDVIEEDSTVSIYQNKEFSLSLFRDFFKISAFNLVPNSVIFELPEKISKEDLERYKLLFPDYVFDNPLNQIEESIEESTKFLKYILIAFSGVSTVSSLVLMIIVTLINAIEARKEIAILKVLGFNNFEIMKIFIVDNLFNSTLCFVTSMFGLLITSVFVGKYLSSSIGLSGLTLFTPFSLLVNIVIVILISVLATLGSYFEIKNIKLSENLH